MSHRPYPNVDRALAQVHRHAPVAPVLPLPDCLHPMADSFDRLREQAYDRALDGPMWQPGLKLATPPVDEYRLSTRRPIAGGNS